jgi:hypothetical protein
MNHYLITLSYANMHMHCYLMCEEDYEATSTIADKMFQIAEEQGIKPWPQIVLATKLSTGVAKVHKVLNKIPEAKASLKASKKFHCIMWCMHQNEDKDLMELH